MISLKIELVSRSGELQIFGHDPEVMGKKLERHHQEWCEGQVAANTRGIVFRKGLRIEVWDLTIPWALGKGRKYSSFVTFSFCTTKCGYFRIKNQSAGFSMAVLLCPCLHP